jgi:3-methyladenine DNA glycosylase/8-oxoguanine DNA glycosylase
MTASDGRLRIEIVVGSTRKSMLEALEPKVAHMFRLDEDLSPFYEVIGTDDRLGWCATGAGRMLRAPTVFEDVVKTNCTLIRRRYEEPSSRQQDLPGFPHVNRLNAYAITA